MNMKMMKILNVHKQYLKMLAAFTISGSMLLIMGGCSEVDGGKKQNTIELPTDSFLNFECADEGIFEETCVLDNPENPYANVAIKGELEDDDDPLDPNFKFNLSDAAPSAKARYYLWATALAKGAGNPGENQYFTALALHELYAESGSPTTQEQAIKAYRSVLDNYFLTPTFFTTEVNGEVVPFPVFVKDLTGANLHSPTLPTIISLYEDQALALEAMGQWGYVYDVTSGTVSKLNDLRL